MANHPQSGMEAFPSLPGSVLRFSDDIPDPGADVPFKLSILPFDGVPVTNEKISNSHRWSNGIISQNIQRPKSSRPYSTLNNDQSSTSDHSHRPLLRNIIWPMTAIILPISLLSGVLMGLVWGYRVVPEQGLFPSSSTLKQTTSSAWILVNYSATRLVFVASWLSTMAPILASFVMVLWSLPVAQAMRAASVERDTGHLPTPYQLSLIIGVTLASTQRLRRYFEYALSRSRPQIPPVLHKAAMMLTLCVLLACGVFLGDTALHYYTETVPFSKYTTNTQAMHTFGRGPSDECLNWNRTEHLCLPCSIPYWATGDQAAQTQAIDEKGEVFLVQQNISRKSEIRLVQDAAFENADLAILIPQSQSIPPELDFHASTVGVSTQCSLITPNCNLRRTGSDDTETQFNCSSGFYGVLGLQPVLSHSGNVIDPNVPPLNWKPFQNFQYGFYTDPQLTQSYATGAFNSSTDALALSGQCVPDAKLINPVYLGVASRMSSLTLNNDPGVLEGQGESYIDLVLSCSYTTYEVNYTWFNGTVQDVSFAQSPNGTLAEMFHGSQMYATITGGAPDLELNILDAAQQANTTAFMQTWGNLYSVKVLSAIAGYSTGRPSMQEQERTVFLVAKVPTAPLWVIIACSLAYVILGFALGFAAFKSSSSNVQDLAARLSLAGLTAAAFEERDGTGSHERIIKDADRAFSKQEDGTRRVGVEGLAQTGYILNPVISPVSTPMHSRTGSSGLTMFQPSHS
jgi:hypothetical protein